MSERKLAPTTQVGFGELFDELITEVNKDYGFNITHDPCTARCDKNDLTYDESSLVNISLYFCPGGGVYESFEFETTFIEDYFSGSPEEAKSKLEMDLRAALDAITNLLDDNDE